MEQEQMVVVLLAASKIKNLIQEVKGITNRIKNKLEIIFFAVDGGILNLPVKNPPFFFVGDLDSAQIEPALILKKNCLQAYFLNEDKDYTDFEFTLNLIGNNYGNSIVLILGGFNPNERLDQFLSNIFLLFKYGQKFIYVLDKKQIFIKTNEIEIDYKGRFSLLADKDMELNIEGEAIYKGKVNLKRFSSKATSNISNGIVRIFSKNDFLLWIENLEEVKKIEFCFEKRR